MGGILSLTLHSSSLCFSLPWTFYTHTWKFYTHPWKFCTHPWKFYTHLEPVSQSVTHSQWSQCLLLESSFTHIPNSKTSHPSPTCNVEAYFTIIYCEENLSLEHLTRKSISRGTTCKTMHAGQKTQIRCFDGDKSSGVKGTLERRRVPGQP